MSVQLQHDLERHLKALGARPPGVLAGIPDRLVPTPLDVRPPVLPDWLETSEVSYIVGSVGAVDHRGQIVKPEADIRGQEGTR